MKKLQKLGITIACAIPAAAALGVTIGVVTRKAIDHKMIDMTGDYTPQCESASKELIKKLYDSTTGQETNQPKLTKYYFTGVADTDTNKQTTLISPDKVIKDDIYTYLNFWVQSAEFYLYLKSKYPEIFGEGTLRDVKTATANVDNIDINYETEK